MGTRTEKPLRLTPEVFRAANTRFGNACSFARFLKTLSPEDATTVREAIADPTIQAIAILRVLETRGYEGSRQGIARHRQNQCKECRT